MANHEIPRTAKRIERIHGIDADGNVVTCSVYQHRRAGHQYPMFFVVQYREINRRIDRASRVTNQLSGPRAQYRLDTEMAAARRMFAESRERAASRKAT